MKFQIAKGSTSVILTVFIQDSSSTTGAGLASLIHTSSIVGGYVKRNGLGIALAVDEDVTTEGTYQAPTTAAQVRIGTPANMRAGTYELHFHNDLFTTEDWVTITLGGATNMADLPLEIQLTSIDLNDTVRGGMTALPNAVADAAGGLPISDAGGLDLDTILGRITANVALASVCTEARLVELAAANLPADIDTLLGRIIGTLATGTHNPATAAQIAVLSDWIDAGRLDAILDAINASTAGLSGAAMRGTDSAALASVCTEVRLAELAAGNLPTDIAAINTLVSNLNDLSAAQVNAEVDTGLGDFFVSAAQLVIDFWSDTLTTYTGSMAGKRVKGLSAVPFQEGTINDVSATTVAFTTTLTGLAVNALKDGLFLVEVAADEWEGKPVLSSDASGGVILSEALTSAPANGSSVAFKATHIHPVSQIQSGLATEAKQDAQDLIITESRLAELDTANLPTDIAAINTIVSNLNDPTAAAVAAAVASYDMGNGRTIEEALAFLRNKWTIIGGVLTVYDTDDTTVLWTSAMTQTAGNPVSASDPV